MGIWEGVLAGLALDLRHPTLVLSYFVVYHLDRFWEESWGAHPGIEGRERRSGAESQLPYSSKCIRYIWRLLTIAREALLVGYFLARQEMLVRTVNISMGDSDILKRKLFTA
jgi:hypothetical protein